MTQSATITNPRHENMNAKSHRKEKGFYQSYVLIGTKDGAISNLADLRLYRTAQTVYACLWVHGNDIYLSGSGKAGGGGYHKASAAAAIAFGSAGVTLAEPIDGRGDGAIVSALTCLGQAMGKYDAYHVIDAHA